MAGVSPSPSATEQKRSERALHLNSSDPTSPRHTVGGGGDDGARTRDLCRDRAQESGNLQKISVTDGSFWRSEARMVTVIVPLLCPRPLPYRPLPSLDITGDLGSTAAAGRQKSKDQQRKPRFRNRFENYFAARICAWETNVFSADGRRLVL